MGIEASAGVRRVLGVTMAVIAITAWACGAPGRALAAEDDGFSRQTLRGLKGFYLLIGDVDPDLVKGGLTRDAISEEVEKRLRRIPVQLLTLKEGFQEHGRPYLELSLMVSKPSTGPYGCFIEVSLNQEIRPTRPIPGGGFGGTGALHGQTWRVRSTAVTERDKASALLEPVGRLVDRFVDDYLSVNKDARPQ